MSEKHVYEVKIGSITKAYVEAESPAKARTLALSDLTVRRLNGDEVRALVAQGKSILDNAPQNPPSSDGE